MSSPSACSAYPIEWVFDMTSYVKLVGKFLEDRPDKLYSKTDIFTWIYDTCPEKMEKKRRDSKTPEKIKTKESMIRKLIQDFGSQERKRLIKYSPNIEIIPPESQDNRRKWQYRYTTNGVDLSEVSGPTETKPSSAQTADAIYPPKTSGLTDAIHSSETPRLEDDLYPKLGAFIKSKWLTPAVHSMRIDERKSSNTRGTRGNHWLYPDVVGMQDLSSNFERETKDILDSFGDKKAKLWSFEVKLEISAGNVRESFFQAVSNSSWANLGYLVSENINEQALQELRILCNLHGIGYIQLNAENPEQSNIAILATERTELDWQAINRITEVNPDFRDYVNRITDFNKTGRVNKKDWY